VVRTLNPHQIFIERIHRDNGFWDISMLTKLESFYNKVLLPELASPREGQSPGIREPGKTSNLQIQKWCMFCYMYMYMHHIFYMSVNKVLQFYKPKR
jgi:hypothetical protein